jgi:hypothetical protein
LHSAGGPYSGLQHRQVGMFAFYSNRVGCLGSIVISLILSVILIAVMAMLNSGF